MDFERIPGGFTISLNGRCILRYTEKRPCFAVGTGVSTVESHSGVFKVREREVKRVPLTGCEVLEQEEMQLLLAFGDTAQVSILQAETGLLKIHLKTDESVYNRFWIDIQAQSDESIYGGGELFDRQNLKGSVEPLWISEPGVGRRLDAFTLSVAAKTKHWPHWYNTNFAMPAWISSSGLLFHSDSSAYGELDLSHRDVHSYYSWDIPEEITIGSRPTMKDALSSISDLLGRQPKLPSWAYDGMWVGMQGGRKACDEKIRHAKDADLRLGAIWCQDWEGIRMTSFGKQLKWCWQYDGELYEDLPQYIEELKEQGIRYLAYTNTFLTPGSEMFDEADRKGYLIKKENGENYPVYVPFDPGMLVDFTNPEAREWMKGIIRKNLLDIGISGWMADFGEYIPSDSKLHSQESPLTYHNRYPADWARINHEAVQEAGLEDEAIFFMRASSAKAIPHMSAFWTGDQLVDWSKADGLPSAINASLMMGVSGVGYVHSDVGGYTTLGYKKRSRELLVRWAEYAAFTQIMRSHEGNRPQSNVQFDSDDELISEVAHMTRVYAALKPYHMALSEEYQETGIPPMRMMQLHYPEERRVLEKWQYQYLYGEDLLVAPVIRKNSTSWDVYLPDDSWVHLWSGKSYRGNRKVRVLSPWGEPPVFYREESPWKGLFEGLRSC